jgi:hypothetical protein
MRLLSLPVYEKIVPVGMKKSKAAKPADFCNFPAVSATRQMIAYEPSGTKEALPVFTGRNGRLSAVCSFFSSNRISILPYRFHPGFIEQPGERYS